MAYASLAGDIIITPGEYETEYEVSGFGLKKKSLFATFSQPGTTLLSMRVALNMNLGPMETLLAIGTTGLAPTVGKAMLAPSATRRMPARRLASRFASYVEALRVCR